MIKSLSESFTITYALYTKTLTTATFVHVFIWAWHTNFTSFGQIIMHYLHLENLSLLTWFYNTRILFCMYWVKLIWKNASLNIRLKAGVRTRNEPQHDKTNKMTVHPAKTQISLGIRPVWSESSLYAHWVAKDPSFLHADSEDSDQTGRMPKLIWVFAGRTLTLLVLSCRCPNNCGTERNSI